MGKAERALNAILMVGIEDAPQSALLAKAHTLVEMFRLDCAAEYLRQGKESIDLGVTDDLVRLREVVDRELDRRLDEDLTDTVTDVLADVCLYLHRATRALDCQRPWTGDGPAGCGKV